MAKSEIKKKPSFLHELFKTKKIAALGLCLLIFFLLIAVFADVIAPVKAVDGQIPTSVLEKLQPRHHHPWDRLGLPFQRHRRNGRQLSQTARNRIHPLPPVGGTDTPPAAGPPPAASGQAVRLHRQPHPAPGRRRSWESTIQEHVTSRYRGPSLLPCLRNHDGRASGLPLVGGRPGPSYETSGRLHLRPLHRLDPPDPGKGPV